MLPRIKSYLEGVFGDESSEEDENEGEENEEDLECTSEDYDEYELDDDYELKNE